MANPALDKVFADYLTGKVGLEETNEKLAAFGLKLQPGKNEITAEEAAATKVGATPAEATGYGLLYSGTGFPDKVHVVAGKLVDGAVNEVTADGKTNNFAQIRIADKIYEVKGDTLV